MIATALVEEIRHMLREGRLSQREIAKRLGVSRGTVNAIASGRRREQVRRPEQAEDDGFIPPTGLPKHVQAAADWRRCHVWRVTSGRRTKLDGRSGQFPVGAPLVEAPQ